MPKKYITDADAAKDYAKLEALISKKETAYRKYQSALSAEQKAKKAVDDAIKAIETQKQKMAWRGTISYPNKSPSEFHYAWGKKTNTKKRR